MFVITKKIISFFWLPVAIIVSIFVALYNITNIKSSENLDVVFGIALGVALGFIADIAKSKIDEFQKWFHFRQTSLKLLELDAKNVFTTLQSMKDIISSIDTAPKDLRKTIETAIPLDFKLFYWKRLNENNDFLLLGSEEPFDEIFKKFSDLDKFNELVRKAHEKDHQSYMFSKAIHQTMMNKDDHRRLLSLFMSSAKIDEFHSEWKQKIRE